MKPYSIIMRENDLVFISGILPDLSDDNIENVYLQTLSIFDKFDKIVEEHNLENYHVTNTKLFLNSITDISQANQAYLEYFKESLPTRSAVGGVELVNNVKVEIELTLFRNS